MKSENVKIEFTLFNKEKVIMHLPNLTATDYYVDCRPLIKENAKGWLITKKHQQLQTRFNLTEVVPYALLGFDEKREFESVIISMSRLKAPFETLQTANYFILLPMQGFVALERVKNIKIGKDE